MDQVLSTYNASMIKTMPLLCALTFLLAGCQQNTPSGSPQVALDGEVLTYIEKNDTQVGIYKVDEIVSQESDIHTFVTKIVAPALRASTEKLNAEICGSVCVAPEGSLGITVTTIGSKASCPVTNACPKGMTVTQDHIHTHVDGHSYHPSPIDKLFLKDTYDEDEKVFTSSEQFSDKDLETPFGFLITSQRVLYQEGINRVFVVQE